MAYPVIQPFLFNNLARVRVVYYPLGTIKSVLHSLVPPVLGNEPSRFLVVFQDGRPAIAVEAICQIPFFFNYPACCLIEGLNGRTIDSVPQAVQAPPLRKLKSGALTAQNLNFKNLSHKYRLIGQHY